MQRKRQFMFAKDVPGALAMNKPPRGGLFGEVAHPSQEHVSRFQEPLQPNEEVVVLGGSREGRINYRAQVMERFLYRGMMCYPRQQQLDQFLYGRNPMCSRLRGPLITSISFIVQHMLYKGKKPIEREPVVLSRMIQDHSDLLARLPEDTYSRNALSGSGQGITANVRDEFWQHWSSYFDLPQSGYRPEPLVKSCGIKPVEFKYDI